MLIKYVFEQFAFSFGFIFWNLTYDLLLKPPESFVFKPPWADTPPGRHPRPLGRHPPGQTPRQTPETATAADGTHPTGILVDQR